MIDLIIDVWFLSFGLSGSGGAPPPDPMSVTPDNALALDGEYLTLGGDYITLTP